MWRGRHRSMFSKTSLHTSSIQCYQGRPTSESGSDTSAVLDKLLHRCKDDLSTALRPCCSSGVDTWSPHVLWLGWGSSPPTPASRGQELVTRTELSCCSGDVESRLHTADHNTEPLMLTKVFLTMECCVFYE